MTAQGLKDYGFDKPIDKKRAFYDMMSKAKNRDRVAQAKFEEPPYYMRFLESWTTKREEEEYERNSF